MCWSRCTQFERKAHIFSQPNKNARTHTNSTIIDLSEAAFLCVIKQ